MWIKRKKLYLNYVRRNYYAINYEKLNPMYLWFIAITLILPLFVPLFLSQQAQAATVTWDGGGADTNWSTCANWSSDTCPTSTDDVVFSGSGTSTLSVGTSIRSLDMNGYTGTLTHNGAVSLNIGDATAGAGNIALRLGSGMTYTLGSVSTSALNFLSTSATQQTITTGGKVTGNVTLQGNGSSYILGDALTATGGTINVSRGIFDDGGFNITAAAFASSSTNTRTVTFGATTHTFTTVGTSWQTSTITNMTFTPGTSTIILSGANTDFFGGTLTFNNVEITGSGAPSMENASTFANLTRTGTAALDDKLVMEASITVTGTLTLTGNSSTNRLTISALTPGTAQTITCNGSIVVTNADFRDITAAGTASWDLSGATGGSGNALGNTGITFTTGRTLYGVATGNWNSTAVWSLSSGGAAGAAIPLPQDNIVLDANSGAITVTANMLRLGTNITCTGYTGTLVIGNSATEREIQGNFTLVAGMTATNIQGNIEFTGRSSHTLTSAGKTLIGGSNRFITFNGFGGTYTLQDDLVTEPATSADVDGVRLQSSSTLNANGFNVTTAGVSVETGTTLNMGAGTWTIQSTAAGTKWAVNPAATVNASTSTIVLAGATANLRTFGGGGKTYHTLTYTVAGSTGGLDITGSNTFNTINFSDVTNARTLRFTAGTTTTITSSFNVNGTATKLMTIGSITAASHTLTYSGAGDVSSDYLSISRSTATPADTWYAGANSTDGGNNSGWIFTAPPSGTAPNAPTSLIQRKVDDTSLAEGAWTNETTVEFVATATDTDNPDTLQICVEKDLLGTSFSNTEDACGTGVAYAGSGVSVMVSIGSQTDASEYHWQARVKDAGGLYSAWVSYPTPTPNAETARDYGIDTTAPTGGTVYDGTTTDVDEDFNNGSLSQLSANWSGFNSNVSGLNKYQYSIGTSAGATDVRGWTDNGTTASVTASSLTLDTSKIYFFNVRAVDNAGNTQSPVISSDGQMVLPDLSFTVSSTSMTFADLTSSSSPAFTDGDDTSDGRKTTLTTSTNAFNGYVIRAFATALLTSGANTIADYNGGTYASPDSWQSGDTGFGFTSTDTSVQGTNIFQAATCPGGNALSGPGCFAPFTLTGPGDIVADHTASVSGTPISNEAFDIYYQVRVTYSQHAKTYSTSVIYTNTPTY